MKIITSNPVIFNGKCESYADLYIPFDGKNASKETLLAFQKYVNNSGYTPKLKEDGIYGKGTQKAIDSGFGKKWDELNAYIGQSAPTGGSEVKKDEKKKGEKLKEAFKQAKESGLLDKALGLFGLGAKPTEEGVVVSDKAKQDEKTSKGVNIALIIGGVALVGAIIYFATKKK